MNKLRARDIMKKNVVTVEASISVRELAGLLTEKMISGVPVIDENDKPVGVVSLSDIVAHDDQRAIIETEHHAASYFLRGWEDDLEPSDIESLQVVQGEGLTVGDIMTPAVYSVTEDTDIAEMADAMINGRVHRLIVTRAGRVVGIVSTLDMLKAVRSHGI
ncbi:MAG: CBS domain-containing protein [Wenzhouxiangellaceae bacterium]|nr:CBS domain-containing protein [Wenzhouxiangellaceae bacterium]